MRKIKTKKQFIEYITLQDAAKICSYSQEYLSLRARQGKLRAVKRGRNWATTAEWLNTYVIGVGKKESETKINFQITLNKIIDFIADKFENIKNRINSNQRKIIIILDKYVGAFIENGISFADKCIIFLVIITKKCFQRILTDSRVAISVLTVILILIAFIFILNPRAKASLTDFIDNIDQILVKNSAELVNFTCQQGLRTKDLTVELAQKSINWSSAIKNKFTLATLITRINDLSDEISAVNPAVVAIRVINWTYNQYDYAAKIFKSSKLSYYKAEETSRQLKTKVNKNIKNIFSIRYFSKEIIVTKLNDWLKQKIIQNGRKAINLSKKINKKEKESISSIRKKTSQFFVNLSQQSDKISDFLTNKAPCEGSDMIKLISDKSHNAAQTVVFGVKETNSSIIFGCSKGFAGFLENISYFNKKIAQIHDNIIEKAPCAFDSALLKIEDSLGEVYLKVAEFLVPGYSLEKIVVNISNVNKRALVQPVQKRTQIIVEEAPKETTVVNKVIQEKVTEITKVLETVESSDLSAVHQKIGLLSQRITDLGIQIDSRISYTTPAYAPIYIPSSGLQVAGHSLLSTLNITGSGAIGGSLAVRGNASFGDPNDDDTTFTVNSTAVFNKSATFDGGVAANSGLSIGGENLTVGTFQVDPSTGNITTLGTITGATSTITQLTVVNDFLVSGNATTTGSHYIGGTASTTELYVKNNTHIGGNLGLSGSSYINFGATDGDSGYGFKDNSGTMQYKNNSGSWADLGSGSGGGTLGWAWNSDKGLLIRSTTTEPMLIGGTTTTSDNVMLEILGRAKIDTLFASSTLLTNATTTGSHYIGGTASTTELYVKNNAHIGGNLTLDGSATTTGYLYINKDLTVLGSASFANQALTINKSNGYVGVGTTNPTQKFEVYSESGYVFPFFLSVSNDDAPIPGFVGRSSRGTKAAPTSTQTDDYLFAAGGRGFATSAFEGSSSVLIGMRAAEAHSDTNQGTYITFETTPIGSATRTERMRILDSGNVGIGATSPGTSLDVVSTDDVPIFSTAYGTAGGVMAYRANGSITSPTTLTSGNVIGGVFARGYDGSAFTEISNGGVYINAGESWTPSANGTYVTLETTANSGTSRTEKVRITGSGSVGIGTTTPEYKLSVVGQIYATSTSNQLMLVNDLSNSKKATFSVDTNGDLAVSLATASATTTFSNAVKIQRTGGGNENLFRVGTSTKENIFKVMSVGLDGRVGIGVTTTPNNLFQVKNLISFDDTDYNTGLGKETFHSTGLSGAQYNTAVGYQSLKNITTGDNNSAVGYGSLTANTTGSYNSAVGYASLTANTVASANSAVGYGSLTANTTGASNSAVGYASLSGNTTGDYNSAMGQRSLNSNKTASHNSAVGYNALYSNTTGWYNSAVGNYALYSNTTGSSTVALGYFADIGYYPTSSPVTTLASGGSVNTGTHYYKVSFVFDTQESQISASSSPIATTAGNNTVGLTAIPTYTGGRTCTARKIYRTKTADIYNYYLVTTIADNTTTIYTDTALDSSLTVLHSGPSSMIALGYGSLTMFSNQMVIGSSTSAINDIYIGKGIEDSVPTNVTFNTTGGFGTDITGASLTLAGGRGTGSALGGDLIFQTSDSGASGTTLQSLTTKMIIKANGYVGIGTSTPKQLFTVNNGALCVDNGTGVCGSQTLNAGDIFIARNATTTGSHYIGGTASTTELYVKNNAHIGGNLGLSGSSYINFGATDGDSGYGFKDNSGTMQYKNSDGSWANLSSGGGSSLWTDGGAMTYLTDTGDNLGIGTTTPEYKLSVVGQIYATSTNNQLMLVNDLQNSKKATFSVDTNGDLALTLATASATTTFSNALQVQRTSGYNENLFRVGTSTKENIFKVMSVGLDGRVGIGVTTTPNNLFQVKNLISFDDTNFNTGIGKETFHSTGLNGAQYNTAVGYQSLKKITTGDFNSAVGNYSLNNNTSGSSNSAVGYYSLYNNTSGDANSAVGYDSLTANTTGSYNSAVGYYSLYSNNTGYYNSAVGYYSLYSNNTGYYNSAVGYYSLYSNTSGWDNTAIGNSALYYNQLRYANTAIGSYAGYGVTANSFASSTLVGYRSGYSLTTGNSNILLGYQAGESLTTGAKNIVIGYDIDTPAVGSTNTLNIGNLIYATGLDGANTTLSTGNLGLGTTTPEYKLSVVGNIYATSTSNQLMLVNDLQNSKKATFSVNTNGDLALTLATASATTTFSNVVKIQRTGGGNENLFRVGTSTKENIFKVMSVGLDGRVGIGVTTTPNNLFQVKNLISFDDTNFNTGIGKETFHSTGLNGAQYNTAVGYQSLKNITTGGGNIAMGYQSLYSNTEGWSSLAIGYQSLYSSNQGFNLAIGDYSLYSDTSGMNNIAMGYQSLYSNTEGSNNLAVGVQSLYLNNGYYNSAIGYQSLYANTTGSYNSAVGYYSLYLNTTGWDNTAMGYGALYSGTDYANTAVGSYAGYGVYPNSSFASSTLIGYRSGYSLTTGNSNILLGYQAGESLTTGAKNIVIGYDIDTPAVGSTNTLNIGNLIYATGLDGANTTLSTGNVGIGTSTPKQLFTVNNGALCIDDGTGVCGGVGAGTPGDIYYKTAHANWAADIAEKYPSDEELEPGDVVTFDSSSKMHVKKATEAYQSTLAGIVSTEPGMILGDTPNEKGDNYSITLTGRVPVKVNLDNGPIKIGDALTSASSTPGYAMKATEKGRIIGYALEEFDETDVLISTSTNKIIIFMNIGWDEPIESELTVEEKDDKIVEDISVKDIILTNKNGEETRLTLDENGYVVIDKIKAKTIQTERLCIDDVCIDKTQLQELLKNVGGQASSDSESQPSPETKEPVVEKEPVAEEPIVKEELPTEELAAPIEEEQILPEETPAETVPVEEPAAAVTE